ncbi:MAG: AI-2E family transporter [Winkia neuii]|uniref:AI-2E family transporter n=1 Tax=Winkia neuii TaxID=33007 RepID=A0A2I1ILS6_9ACTO|nr:AI-2E family transporter [Winkia neuii]OFJ70803.1 AI-2E family transporter [Actinomyces sp. HMSC064C12]OFK02489.1 AI-2E family transporter [Actinomyces sp. HMSC072A03]OFT53802.1 AI-2E family transporter [Actinomyces sp. HMSC06A08]KWZ74869.1 putative ATP synthase F0, A subunit [Winkia neuii]MDK8099289.1 AI-2E family transporter [Winkia neuii]
MADKETRRVPDFAGTVKRALERIRESRSEKQADRYKPRRHSAGKTVELEDAAQAVSPTLRVAAAWSWRLLLVGFAAACVLWLLSQLTVVVIPLLVALLLTVLLEPIVRLFPSTSAWRTVGTVVALLVGLGLVGGLLYLASSQIVDNIGPLAAKARGGLDDAVDWISNGPLKLDQHQIEEYVRKLQGEIGSFLQSNSSRIASGALAVTSSITNIVTSALMVLFCVFFFLKDGRKIWQFFVRCMPEGARNPANEAAIRGWVTISSYAKAQMEVAAIDAVGIGASAAILGVPLALPIAVLVFLGAFIPIVGAIATGAIAVLVALVDQGITVALIMLAAILVVQQVESNLLQPLLMSNAVSLHPLAVLLAVAAGGFTMGIAGAMFAVPLMAFINTVVMYLHGYDSFLRLAYDPKRPGGAPGTLDDEIARSLQPKANNLREAAKMRQKLQGANAAPDEVEIEVVSAQEAQKAVGEDAEVAQEDREALQSEVRTKLED